MVALYFSKNMIHFRYNPLKTVQAVALLLKLHGKPMNYMGLLKLLYMADRIALQSINQPISGDDYFSMNFGPVLSHVYDAIKNKDSGEPKEIWEKHISTRDQNYQHTKNYDIQLLTDPGDSELSESEEDIIKNVYASYGKLDQFYLADLTHQYFPEWQYPDGRATPISVESVLINVGKNAEEIAEIEQEVAQENYLDVILAE